MVVLTKLVACHQDCGYVTYVFERLEKVYSWKDQYIMCVKFPNWNTKTIAIGDEGYLEYKEIRAGIDKWYDGDNMIPYRYDTIQFLNFVEKPEEKEDHKYVM